MARTKETLDLTSKNRAMYRYLMILTCVVAVGFQGWRTLYNNFAIDEVGITALQNGIIQSIREIPGFLSLLVIYLLLIFKEHRLVLYSVLFLGISIAIAGYLDSFVGLIFSTFLLSTGMHYSTTCNKSLVLQYFDKRQSPIVFARQGSYKALINIGIGIVIFIFSTLEVPTSIIYLIIGISVISAVIYASRIDPITNIQTKQRKTMVLKRKYWLYYIVNFLSGARRQIFVVFAVFILVQRHHYTIMMVTGLFILNNIITFFISPLIGRMINRFDERRVLLTEYTAMVFIFAGYAFLDNAWIVGVLYLLDNILYPCSMAINTYFHKIGDPEDIAPSMAMGFTINHISAVVIPVLGGALWMLDYQIPFILGIILSLFSLFFVNKMRTAPPTK
ncbi:MAG: MFS transporter [Bacteroidaceae bacterium]